jgi:hypothetical protein
MSLQIITKNKAIQKNRGAMAGITNTAPDPYQDRLLKLIPAEVVSVYLVVNEMLAKKALWMSWVAFGLLFIANIAYKRKAGVTDLLQLALTAIAFVLWVMVIGGPFSQLSTKYHEFASILVPIYTLFIPLVYK